MRRNIILSISLCVVVALCVGVWVARLRHEAFLASVSHIASTPPMGWNGWNHFGCSKNVNEGLIKEMVKAIIDSGMKKVGYEYVVLDDCWQTGRDTQGNIIADAKKFPHGMKTLGDYIHAQGLKFGIYTSAGRKTCEKREGSYNHELQDIRTYASWGADYIKVDWCGIEYLDTKTQYIKWRRAIEQVGRPMVLSIAIADIEKIDHNDVWKWGFGIGHMWRTARDVLDYWPDMLRVADQNSLYAQYAKPNGWNDADMLQVGNGGMTEEEYKTHFSLWAMMASPLMAGNDLRNMSPRIKKFLTNPEIIAVDQDPLGRQGIKVTDNGTGQEVWQKPLADGQSAIALFNRAEQDSVVEVTWGSLGIATPAAQVRNLWSHDNLEMSSDGYSVNVPAHGIVMLRVTPHSTH